MLPLNKKMKTIAVIGPNADNIYNMLGDYTAPQSESSVVTVLDGIRQKVSNDTHIIYAKGCAVRDSSKSGFQEAIEAARQSDVVVMVMGGSSAVIFLQSMKKRVQQKSLIVISVIWRVERAMTVLLLSCWEDSGN